MESPKIIFRLKNIQHACPLVNNLDPIEKNRIRFGHNIDH